MSTRHLNLHLIWCLCPCPLSSPCHSWKPLNISSLASASTCDFTIISNVSGMNCVIGVKKREVRHTLSTRSAQSDVLCSWTAWVGWFSAIMAAAGSSSLSVSVDPSLPRSHGSRNEAWTSILSSISTRCCHADSVFWIYLRPEPSTLNQQDCLWLT